MWKYDARKQDSIIIVAIIFVQYSDNNKMYYIEIVWKCRPNN